MPVWRTHIRWTLRRSHERGGKASSRGRAVTGIFAATPSSVPALEPVGGSLLEDRSDD
jgi:hypothetical protein